MNAPLSITEQARERVRAAIDAKAALRLGIDPREGRRIAIRVKANALNHAICGHVVPHPEGVIEIHESDLGAFAAEVEDASQADLDRVAAEQRTRIEENEATRRGSRTARLQHDTWPAVFTAVMRRSPRALSFLEVLSDETPATPAKRSSR